MLNRHNFNVHNDKQILHKAGKSWITAFILLLGLVTDGCVLPTNYHTLPHIVTEARADSPNSQSSKLPRILAKGDSNLSPKVIGSIQFKTSSGYLVGTESATETKNVNITDADNYFNELSNKDDYTLSSPQGKNIFTNPNGNTVIYTVTGKPDTNARNQIQFIGENVLLMLA